MGGNESVMIMYLLSVRANRLSVCCRIKKTKVVVKKLAEGQDDLKFFHVLIPSVSLLFAYIYIYIFIYIYIHISRSSCQQLGATVCLTRQTSSSDGITEISAFSQSFHPQ